MPGYGLTAPDAAGGQAADAPRRPAWRWLPAALLAGCVAVLIGVAVFALARDAPLEGRTNPQTQNAYVGGDVTRVSARVQGYVRALPVDDNRVVHQGDLVAVLDDADYRAQRDQARANLEAAQAQLAAVGEQERQLLVQIEQVRTGETGSRADVGRTAPELARQQALIHTDLGESRLLQQAQADQRRMEAGVEAARAQVAVRERQAETLAAQRREAAAAIGARQADLDLAELNLGWTRVGAPIDGTLGARAVRVGDLVGPGTPIVSETPLEAVWVDANFTERQIPDVRVGQAARLRLDAFPDEPLEGRVAGLSPVTGSQLAALPADNTTGNFTKVVQRVTVRIAIEWRGSRLRGLARPGMSVTATVVTAP